MNPEMLSMVEWIKGGSFTTLSAAVAPLIASCKLQMRLSGGADCYKNYGMSLATIPGLLGRELRQAFYRNTLRRCGRGLKLGFGSYFVSPETEVGENLLVGSYCILGPCTIGNDVIMASHISILDGVHQHGTGDLSTPIIDQAGVSERVSIGDHVWIGEGARVAASVGRHTIVGVGSVVMRPVKNEVVVLGNPARVVGNRADPISKPRAAG
jgi:acetyltransferase-like isoleucine patch superfamily enzyme